MTPPDSSSACAGSTLSVRAALTLGASILVLLAGCGGNGDGNGDADDAPAPAATTTAESGDLEVYEVESAGFALGVPSSWDAASVDDFRESGALDEAASENPALAPYLEALQQPNSPMKFLAGDPEIREDFATNVNVIVEEIPATISAEDYQSANVSHIRRALQVEGELAEEQVELEAGPALRLEYRHEVTQGGQGRELTVVQYILAGEGRGYVITYTTVPEALAEYEAQFASSAATFRLL